MYTIRNAQINDAYSIASVQILSWRETYSGIIPDSFLNNMDIKSKVLLWQDILSNENKEKYNYILETEEWKIVGFISWWISRNKQLKYKWELYAIYVINDHQKQGQGHELIKKLIWDFIQNWINNMLVSVLKDNKTKNFYIKYWAKLLYEEEINIWGKKLIENTFWFDNFNLI